MQLPSALLLCLLSYVRAINVINVQYGNLQIIKVKSGINEICIKNISNQPAFLSVQLHSPFNPLTFSMDSFFDYLLTKHLSHGGIISFLSQSQTNKSMYVHSDYTTDLTAWIKTDGYTKFDPIPGGSGSLVDKNFMDSTLNLDVKTVPKSWNETNVMLHNRLFYWSSVCTFSKASNPVDSGSNGSVEYALYSTPLAVAGGCMGAYHNPSRLESMSVLNRMMFPQGNQFGNLIKRFRLDSIPEADNFTIQLPFARRPGTAYVITLIAEFSSNAGVTWVPYTPTILFGCKEPEKMKTSRNTSTQLNCGVLPSDLPIAYFPVACLLILSLIYGLAFHFWIWPRCVISVLAAASTLGCGIYFSNPSDNLSTAVIVVISVVLPSILTVLVFVLFWCLCIRPTLKYHRVFGRGPILMNVSSVVDESQYHRLHEEPWNDSRVSKNNLDNRTIFPTSDHHRGFTQLPTVREGNNDNNNNAERQGRGNTLESSSTSNDSSVSNETAEHERCGCLRRTPRRFSLQPRRIARMPPVILAVYLIVAFLSMTFDSTFHLNDSVAAYWTFAICVSFVLFGLSWIYKTLTFGISAAAVGIYICISSLCLILLPGALLPHVVLEQFLRFTWTAYRLKTLRIEYYGLYDIVLLVVWIVSTLLVGLLTLCLIRLKDARELAGLQHTGAVSRWSCEQSNQQHLSENEPVRNSAASSSNIFGSVLPGFYPMVEFSSAAAPQFASNSANDNHPLSTATLNSSYSLNTGNVPRAERLPILASAPRTSTYGGLASTSQPQLLPLSRVQLATTEANKLQQSVSNVHNRPSNWISSARRSRYSSTSESHGQ